LKRNLKLGIRGVASKAFPRAARLVQVKAALRVYMKKEAASIRFLPGHFELDLAGRAVKQEFHQKMHEWTETRLVQERYSQTA
jgi:hypothetical protein